MVSAAALIEEKPSSRDAEELIVSVHEVIRTVLRRLHPALEAEGVSMGQFWALHLVSSLRSASLSRVARHLNVSAPTVCANIDQLEAAGLVTRHRSERDRRAVDLSLTSKGRRVETRIWARMGEVMAEATRGLPPEDVAAAARVFRELASRLEPSDASAGEAA